MAINPNDSAVWNKLGIAYQRMGQFALAQAQFERTVKLNAKYAEAWNNLGSCCHVIGRYKQAIRYYLKAIDARPSFAAAYKNMGSGRVDSAIEFLKKARAAGFVDFQKVRRDPDFKAVVADARFESMVHGIGN